MRLNMDEACYYEGEATAYDSKEVITGYKRRSRGNATRIMEGFTFYKSNSTDTAIREMTKTAYNGRLFITNERIVFLAEKCGFDIDYFNLSCVDVYNKYIEVFAGEDFYRVFSEDTAFIKKLIMLMNKCYEEQTSDKEY